MVVCNVKGSLHLEVGVERTCSEHMDTFTQSDAYLTRRSVDVAFENFTAMAG